MSKGYFNLRTMMAIGAMVVLAACGGTGNNSSVPSNSSVESGTPAATAGAATGAEGAAGAGTTGAEGATGSEGANTAGEGNVGADAAATAAPTQPSMESGAATSGDTGTGSTGTTIGTATPDANAAGTPPNSEAGATGATTGTPLTGPNISFGGITFNLEGGAIPSVTAMSGSINEMAMSTATGAGATSGNATGGSDAMSGTDMAGSGNLSGTVFTFQGINTGAGSASTTGNGAATGDAMSGATGLFQPRLVVIPVAQLVSYEASMMVSGQSDATGAASTDSGAAGSTTNAAGTATPAAATGTDAAGATGSMTDQGITDDLFISELSRTLASQSAFPSTSMANSMVLTRALSLLGFGGYTPAFQSNGEFLDFESGRGVRFVTAFQQEGGNPAALNSLYYMFHGLTTDNQYYVMALMPLQSSVIGSGAATGSGSMEGTATPAASSATMTDTAGAGTTGTMGSIEFPSGGDASAYQSYLDQVVAGLDQAVTGSNDAAFSQSLAQYDALIESLSIAKGAQ